MMTFNRRISSVVLSAATAAVLLAGCTDTDKTKEQAQAALAKQAEMKQFAFSGQADVNLGIASSASNGASSNAALSSLTALFSKSKWTWTGSFAAEPLRMEADYKVSPGGSSQALSLPMIVKDNLLYLSIPYLNKEGEYFSFDMKRLGANGQQGTLPVEGLKNTNTAASRVASLLIEDAESKWFKKAKEPITLKDGKEGTSLRLDITDKNREALSAKLKTRLPEIAGILQENGILTAQQAEKLKANLAQNFEITGPGEVAVVTDDTGFVRELKIDLDFRSGSAPADRHILYGQAFDAINQTPPFTKDVPKDARSFDEVLKLLAPAKK